MAPMEPRQLGEWFNAWSRALVLYVRQWTETQAAEDIVQEVFLGLASQRTLPGNVKGWLFRAARNAAVDHWRRSRRRAERERQVALNHRAWFEPVSAEGTDAEAIQAALRRLPDEQREIVVLRIWGGLTLQEVSQVVAAPVSTVFDRYKSALVLLRRELEES